MWPFWLDSLNLKMYGWLFQIDLKIFKPSCQAGVIVIYLKLHLGLMDPAPLLRDFFWKKILNAIHMIFLPFLKFVWLTFKTISMALVALGSCHMTSPWQGVNKNWWFFRFLEHISVSVEFVFMVSFLISRTYRLFDCKCSVLWN